MEKTPLKHKAAIGDNLLKWLKEKYPVANVTLLSEYAPYSYIGSKGTSAVLGRASDTLWKMTIAANRDTGDVMRSVAHEFAHFKQVHIDKVPYTKLGYLHEVEAWDFSTKEVNAYLGV